jgi:ribosomal-protein-alanine N-acetyltransferase
MPNFYGKNLKAMAVMLAPLAEEHLDAILAVQTGAPEAAQWSREDYRTLIRSGARGWVATVGNSACGFLVVRIAADEMEILNFAVEAAHRRQGIGSKLLAEASGRARQERITKIHLEVRASNRVAREFYEARNFRRTGLRPNYYRHPDDDALLLCADVV